MVLIFSAKEALLIISFNLTFSLIYNIWVHKSLLHNNFSRILLFHLCVIVLNIVLNFYMIELYGIKGAAISTMVQDYFIFIINVNRPTEIIIILKSVSFIRFLQLSKIDFNFE